MNRLTLIISFVVFFFSSLASASGQFYFIAKSGPEGGASVQGQNQRVVYLRWDILEGKFPEDVQSIRLERDGAVLGQWLVEGSRSEAEIYQLFSEPGQQQRLLQLVTMLKELSLSELQQAELGEAQDFDVNLYAPELLKRLEGDVFWPHFASRQNFDIARVRNRAYLDRDVELGKKYTYSLYAVSLTDKSALIGRTLVDTSMQHGVLPVRDLRQLPIADSCDSTKDHYTVALDWLAAGETVTDRASNNIQLAGYEIYRTIVDSGNNPVARDFAMEAKISPHGGRGEVVFDGLERVNSTLLMLDGDGTDNPEFVEARDKLSLAGLKPGDRRTYYVVGRDFSGHYGPSVHVVVQVPHALPPVTPWNIDSGYLPLPDGGVRLAWDSVNVENYIASKPDLTICNATEAVQTGIIEYISTDGDLQCDQAFTARADVINYQLYRFNSFAEARGFKDRDGDGVSDAVEYAEQSQCDALAQPDGAVSYAIDNADIHVQQGLRSRQVFSDQSPVLETGSYYWYRISSYTADGKYSLPSRPIRVLVPDLTAPASPTVEVTRTVSTQCCQVEALDKSQESWQFTDTIGGHSIVLVEGDQQSGAMTPINFGSDVSSLCLQPGQIDGFWGARDAQSQLRQLVYTKDKKNGSYKNAYCVADIPADMDLCKSGSWQLSETTCSENLPLGEGEVTDGPVTVGISTGEIGACLEYHDTIAGQRTLTHTSCGTDTPGYLEIVVENGFACGTAVARDESSNISSSVALPCTVVGVDDPISPPQMLSLSTALESLTFSWRTPLQLTASTLIEISSDIDSTDTQILTFANEGLESGRVFNDKTAVINELLTSRDQWCVRGLSVGAQIEGQSARFSGWSGSLCKTRRASGPDEVSYLPWPKISPLPAGAPLKVELARDYVSDQQGQEQDKLAVLIHFAARQGLFNADDGMCQYVSDGATGAVVFSGLFLSEFHCSLAGKARIENPLALPFILYRQGRSPDGSKGTWVQVSPLKTEIKWTASAKLGSSLRYYLSDDNFVLYRHSYSEDIYGSEWQLAYRDYYPYIRGYDYRYQMVTFTDKHAIESWRLSDWVSPGPIGGE